MTDYLSINLPICKLDNNKFKIPKTCNRLWLDVGTSLNSPNSAQFLKRQKNGFVIGFEPNPRMYFTIYSMYYINQNKWLIDKHHPTALIEREKRKKYQRRQIFNNTEEFISKNDFMTRYLFIPVGISDTESIKKLYINKNSDGSNSLDPSWEGCNINNYIKIKTFPLKKFIEMIPDHLDFIEHLKIDCEGHDLVVLKSAGKTLNKIAVITVEDNNCRNYLLNNNFIFLEKQNGGYSYINKIYKHLVNKLDYFIRV